MQTYISDIIPKIQRFSQKLDDLTFLTNQHWVIVDEINRSKTIYIFRSNGELLISSNGKVEKGKWEYLGNNSLLIDKESQSYLFKHGFFDENILALKIDGKDEYAFLINENKYEGELNSYDKVIDFLNKKYINPQIQKSIEAQYEIEKPQPKINQQIKEDSGYVSIFIIIALFVFFVFVFALSSDTRHDAQKAKDNFEIIYVQEEIGDSIRIRLDQDTNFRIKKWSFEHNVLKFIANSQPIDLNSYNSSFNFDTTFYRPNTRIDTGFTKIQIQNLSKIMKANPSLRIKISGYNDIIVMSEGKKVLPMYGSKQYWDQLNKLWILANRPQNVKDQLVKLGIDKYRVDTNCYGEYSSNINKETLSASSKLDFQILTY